MPGGVSSPVRAFKSVGGNPVVFDRVKGAYAWDVDGNEYIDYVGTWGPAILGHADDDVLAAVGKTMAKGTSFGAPARSRMSLPRWSLTLFHLSRWCVSPTREQKLAWE
jgi:glutamate-1-semialdehyde aminotransferase